MFGNTFKKVAAGALTVAALGAGQLGNFAKDAARSKLYLDKLASGSAKIVTTAAKGSKPRKK